MSKLRGEITKNKILKVAENLFSPNGYDATSVDKIAKTAEVNKALIYYHFKDKNDILFSTTKNVIKDISETALIQTNMIELDKNTNSILPQKRGTKTKKYVKYLTNKKNMISLLLMKLFKKSFSESINKI